MFAIANPGNANASLTTKELPVKDLSVQTDAVMQVFVSLKSNSLLKLAESTILRGMLINKLDVFAIWDAEDQTALCVSKKICCLYFLADSIKFG